MTKGEKIVISISIFYSSVVCIMDKNLLNAWLVILEMVCKTYYAYLISIYDLEYYSCLSIYVVYL
jgi:hypothetical protein